MICGILLKNRRNVNMRYINEIRDGERVIEHYLVRRKELRESRTGKNFLSLKLMDKTGTIDAKIWEMTNSIGDFDEGNIVKVDGTITTFQNELQMKITKLRRSNEGEYVSADYIPTTTKNIDEMYKQVLEIIKDVRTSHIKNLLENMLVKDKELAEKFRTHQAAMYVHHGFVGGLLEHTLSVAEVALSLGARYKYVNLDLLAAGALLHDIGKVHELQALPNSEYTDDGQMLGHIIIGIEMISKEIDKIPDFPHETASLIKHLIISHHGEYEFGSPKLPATPEAMLLHFADNVDAKLTTFAEVYEKDSSQGKWTGFQKSLGRYIRKPGNV